MENDFNARNKVRESHVTRRNWFEFLKVIRPCKCETISTGCSTYWPKSLGLPHCKNILSKYIEINDGWNQLYNAPN